MPYQLVLTQKVTTKDIGKNVFFDNLKSGYNVYILYYPGVTGDKVLKQRLIEFGEQTGNNCFVNIAKLDDPNYNKVRKTFGINTFPTIIITATSDLSACPSEDITAYVRIDNKALLKSSDEAFSCIERVYNLFISREILQALRINNKEQLKAEILDLFKKSLGKINGFLKEWDINFCFVSGTLELRARSS